jgi:hypothetical protein
MAPDVWRRTPHDGGVLDRTGIVAASAPSDEDEKELPSDAYRPRSHRFQFTALATVILMFAVVITGVRQGTGGPSGVAPTTAGGPAITEAVPVVSTPRPSRPTRGDEPESSVREVPLPPSSTSPESSTEPIPEPSIVLPTQRPGEPDVLDVDDERPVSVQIPSAEVVPDLGELPWAVVLDPNGADRDRLRAREDSPSETPEAVPVPE